MKTISVIVSLFLSACLLLCVVPNAAFAQDAAAAESNDWVIVPDNWEETSDTYRRVGWGFFGTGVALSAIGAGLMGGGSAHNSQREDADDKWHDEGNELMISGGLVLGLGCLFLIPGVSVLIADAVKFNQYRDLGLAKTDDQVMADELQSWKKTSAQYRGWGWGLFGVGTAMLVTGSALLIADPSDDEFVISGMTVAVIGSALIIPGVSLLIADAVKFNKYRDGSTGFQWRPEIYLSPEMTGVGISGRF